MSDTIAWRDSYNIGVEVVDNAHQQLFIVAKRLLKLTLENEKGGFAYSEGVKYLLGYTQRHFQEEEEYMREIQFPYYEAHKKIHDTLSRETLPPLERKIELSQYPTEMVEEFLGIYIGWLRCHIMIEDQMITGKIPARSFIDAATMEWRLDKALPIVCEEIVQKKARVYHARSIGYHFRNHVTHHCKVIYEAQRESDGEKTKQEALRICFSMEERMIQAMLKDLLKFEEDVDIPELTIKMVLEMFTQAVMHRLCAYVDIGDVQYRLTSCEFIEQAEARTVYKESMRHHEKGGNAYSVLLSTSLGHCAVCITRTEA